MHVKHSVCHGQWQLLMWGLSEIVWLLKLWRRTCMPGSVHVHTNVYRQHTLVWTCTELGHWQYHETSPKYAVKPWKQLMRLTNSSSFLPREILLLTKSREKLLKKTLVVVFASGHCALLGGQLMIIQYVGSLRTIKSWSCLRKSV